MDISYKWLIELTALDWSVEQVADRLTLCGTACEYIKSTSMYMDKVLVGEVISLKPIEGASKIQLVNVNLGERAVDVVCGAPNIAVGQKVPVALEGAQLFEDIVIKKVKIRGIESSSMICSEKELGISDDHSGIMVLADSAVAGTPLAEQLDYDDYILTFELTPNRPDSMSAIGIARDLAALASIKVQKPAFKIKESKEKASDCIKVIINDTIGCPRYAARVIRNVKVAPSPWWIKKKLLTCGIRPISNVVDITNLVMLETGHPMHAFDLARFGSNEVVVRKALKGENFTTLDGENHELTPDVLLITNGKVGVAAGGVMGGIDSEVENTTTDILLEAAYFNPSVIRKSRKKLGIVSESSSRFEKGADPNGIPYAINRGAYLFKEICGGEILDGIVDCYPQKIEPIIIKFRPDRCNKILGTEISKERMKQILVDLEFEVKVSELWEVTIPTFRPDIEREIDLIEEIVRIEGYDKIIDAKSNVGDLYTPIQSIDSFEKGLRQLLTGSGFDEMVCHGLTDSRMAKILNPDLPQLKIINPLSEELNIMRNSLAQTALTVIGYNLAHRNLDLKLFELGSIYFPPDNKGNWVEQANLVIAVTGKTPHTWRDKPREFDYYDISGAIEKLSNHFGWGKINYSPKMINYFENNISFNIILDKKPIGIIGKVESQIARKFDIKQTVYVAELNIRHLFSLSGDLKEYQAVPVYPAATRDLAIIVNEKIKAGDMIELIRKNAGKIAESVEIFDLYTGKQIEKDKKSIAISIVYRSSEGSLSSEQIDKTQQIIVNKLEKEYNAVIRDK
ncbi:MAG: phenylalanine--tRNA ligase subunit beta [Candidatus Zixiibacteriota bacterium]